jgi:hypothetical protein
MKINVQKLVILATVAALAIFVGYEFHLSGDPGALLTAIATWFDPVFFQYNLLMALFSFVVIPGVTLFYIGRGQPWKIERLEQHMPPEVFNAEKDYLEEQIKSVFKVSNYLPSAAILVVVVLFGIGILLLFKPMPLPVTGGVPASGVDFSRGANFLMLGPFMYEFVTNDKIYLHWLMVSLTAFQFGFAGAYVYFLTHLVRSYFTLDLTPDFFIASSVRMIMGSVIAVVVSFAVVDIDDSGAHMLVENLSIGWLPILSFMIGYFPDRAILWISKQVSANFGMKQADYQAIPLEVMSGMSHAHEIRLRREGFDNVENLAQGHCLGLAVRTGFNYRQLRDWIGEAWLRSHLRDDYEAFRLATGIGNADDLREFIDKAGSNLKWEDFIVVEDALVQKRLAVKADILSRLLPASS